MNAATATVVIALVGAALIATTYALVVISRLAVSLARLVAARNPIEAARADRIAAGSGDRFKETERGPLRDFGDASELP